MRAMERPVRRRRGHGNGSTTRDTTRHGNGHTHHETLDNHSDTHARTRQGREIGVSGRSPRALSAALFPVRVGSARSLCVFVCVLWCARCLCVVWCGLTVLCAVAVRSVALCGPTKASLVQTSVSRHSHHHHNTTTTHRGNITTTQPHTKGSTETKTNEHKDGGRKAAFVGLARAQSWPKRSYICRHASATWAHALWALCSSTRVPDSTSEFSLRRRHAWQREHTPSAFSHQSSP